ncbi:hypothetical protein CBOM_05588 [Ceraceosorus bombacis]|uniref:Uncharacterized protein n=1 Tax=Ceraceosorus bombacis TaxID=401625 RepID=A0A0P1BQS5_9BASI|nr:hypothetical protein CBOM_05588 [Ceraceosorus bombacis]
MGQITAPDFRLAHSPPMLNGHLCSFLIRRRTDERLAHQEHSGCMAAGSPSGSRSLSSLDSGISA